MTDVPDRTSADTLRLRFWVTSTHAVEQRLTANAPNEGESRRGGRRVIFAAPLAVTYQVESDGLTATVLHVRLFPRRKR